MSIAYIFAKRKLKKFHLNIGRLNTLPAPDIIELSIIMLVLIFNHNNNHNQDITQVTST